MEKFDDYPILNVNEADNSEAEGKKISDLEKLKKKYKKLKKKVRKQSRLLEQQKAEEGGIITQNTNIENTEKPGKKTEKKFLEKLGDVFLKAVPKLLETVVTVSLTWIFGRSAKQFRQVKRVMG